MHKDKLALLLLLTVFALLGADCQAPWDDDDEDERPLPTRAFASSPLLRAYYDMRTFPEEMRELKIPEGRDFDDDHLTVQFEMGGSVTVEEVRTHLYIVPPKGTEIKECELVCRCVAPNGTTSAWKVVNMQVGDKVALVPEVTFLSEFDGLSSDGIWRIQLKDHLDDSDGRCVFRNASLHINRGEFAGWGGAPNETQILDAATGVYGPVPEASGERMVMDIGWFGTKRMLANQFTFTGTTFYVRSFTLVMSFYILEGNNFSERTFWVLVAPSGNWHIGVFLDDDAEKATGGALTLATYATSRGSTPDGPMNNMNGEPSAGTWTLYIVDTEKNNNVSELTTDWADTTGGSIVPDGAELTLYLEGVS
jgi:hypothetical protein